MINFLKGLAIGLLCILCFILGVVFNVEFLKTQSENKQINAFIFKTQLETSNKLKPNTYLSSPNFSASNLLSNKQSLSAEDKLAITKSFNAIIERIKQDKICSGGTYSVEPTFYYKDGVSNVSGQRFFASLNCEFEANQLDTYNTLMQDIDKIARDGGYFSVNLPALEASFTQEELVKNNQILFQALLKKALEGENNFSKDLNKICKLKDFESQDNAHFAPILKASLLSASSKKEGFSSSLPVVGEQTQILSAFASYECF